MATNYTNSPSVGDTVSDNGSVKRWNGTYWESIAPVGPGVVVTEITDGGTFTPPTGSRWHQVHLWGPGDDEPEIASYTITEMGASASVNIGTEADGTDSTFNPAGTGSTLTAPAGYPVAEVVLASGTVSGTATAEFDLSGYSGFSSYKLIIHNWYSAHTSEDIMHMQVSTDGGSTYVTSSVYNYHHWYGYEEMTDYTDLSVDASANTTYIDYIGPYVDRNADSTNIGGGTVYLWGFDGTSKAVVECFAMGNDGPSSNGYSTTTRGYCDTSGADAFKLVTNSATNMTMVYSLVGVR